MRLPCRSFDALEASTRPSPRAPSAPGGSSATARPDRRAPSRARRSRAPSRWPVMPQSSAPCCDVARHLLRADQHALDLGVVDRRVVGASRERRSVAREREELPGRVLEAPLRQAEPQRRLEPPGSTSRTRGARLRSRSAGAGRYRAGRARPPAAPRSGSRARRVALAPRAHASRDCAVARSLRPRARGREDAAARRAGRARCRTSTGLLALGAAPTSPSSAARSNCSPRASRAARLPERLARLRERAENATKYASSRPARLLGEEREVRLAASRSRSSASPLRAIQPSARSGRGTRRTCAAEHRSPRHEELAVEQVEPDT